MTIPHGRVRLAAAADVAVEAVLAGRRGWDLHHAAAARRHPHIHLEGGDGQLVPPATVRVVGAVRVYDPQAQGLACTGKEDRLAEPGHGDLDGLVRLLRTTTPGPQQGRSPSGSRQGQEQKDSLAHHGRGAEQATCVAPPAARAPFRSGRARSLCGTHTPPPTGCPAGSSAESPSGLLGVLLRLPVEAGLAVSGAEVVRLALVLGPRGRPLRIHLHTAHGVLHALRHGPSLLL